MTETHETRTASARRAPKFSVFIGVGVIVGIIVSVALALAFPADPSIGMLATAGYVALYGAVGGALLGAVVVLIADAVSRKRAKLVQVERGLVDLAPIEPVDDDSAS